MRSVLYLTVGLGVGGAEKLMSDLAIRIAQRGFTVTVLALKGWGPFGDVLRSSNIPVYVLGGRHVFDGRVVFLFQRFLATHPFDVIHAHLLWANALACLGKRRYHKIIWHDHRTDEWMRGIHRLIERLFIKKSDLVIAVSHAVKQRIETRVPSIHGRVMVVPNRIPIPTCTQQTPELKSERKRTIFGLSPQHQVIGFIGRLDEPEKGLKFLFQAAQGVLQHKPETRFVVIGDGPARKDLETLCHQLGLTDFIYFMGEQIDVQRFYEGFDILALPSLSEAFGLVLLEAMACSLPVVATRVGGIPEVVLDQTTGVLVPPADSKALSEAMLYLLENPAIAEQMGQEGRKRVEQHFNIKATVHLFEKIYTEERFP